jgi:hypothetical protein
MLFTRSGYLPVLGISLLSLAINTVPVMAQSTVNIKTDYDFSTSVNFLENNVAQGVGEGIANNTPFGFKRFNNTIFSRSSELLASLETGREFAVNSDPKALGLPGEAGGVTFFGANNDKLFGTLSGVNTINPQTSVISLLVNINITGGEGRFSNATGRGAFSGTVALNPTQPVNRGKLGLNLFVTTPKSVPESNNISGVVAAALSIGILKEARSKKEEGRS